MTIGFALSKGETGSGKSTRLPQYCTMPTRHAMSEEGKRKQRRGHG